jgi:hypothetical protein
MHETIFDIVDDACPGTRQSGNRGRNPASENKSVRPEAGMVTIRDTADHFAIIHRVHPSFCHCTESPVHAEQLGLATARALRGHDGAV